VCSGQGIAEAAAYQGDGPHLLVLISSDGESHAWSGRLPDSWDPDSVGEVELVACVYPEGERSIEVCRYDGPDITRYRHEMEIRLLAAQTGRPVASTVLSGNDPRACRLMEDHDLVRLEGTHVSYDDVEAWLRGYADGASQGSAHVGALAPRPDWAGQEVWVYCGQAIGMSPLTVDGGVPAILTWSWMGGSEANVWDYIDAAAFDLQLDGESMELSGAVLSGEECEWGMCLTWRLPPVTLAQGKHTAVMTVTLSREVSTGLDFDENGVPESDPAGEWESLPCEIVVN
jgi:hypothetical protein